MKKMIFLFLSSMLALNSFSQTPCNLDNTFANGGKLVADGSRLGEHIVVQADGKILVACNPFGNGNAYIKRFNTDGTVDATYGNAGMRTISVAEIATNITGMAQYGGNIYLCGTTTTNIGGTNTYVFAAAVDATGSFINTFGTNGIAKFNTAPKLYISDDICISNTGEIYIAGVKSFNELYVMKLNMNGTLNTGYDIDGIVYVNTNNAQHWYEVTDMDLDKNNKVVICGKKSKANNQAPNFWNILVMRFNANGSLDNSFANSGIGLYNSDPNFLEESKKILVSPSGDYYVCGDSYDGDDYDYTVVKVKSDGMVDNTFGNAGWAIHDLEYNNEFENPLNAALMTDGRILITGNQGSGDTVYFSLFMLKPDGSRDVVFAPNGLYKNIFNVNNNSSSSGLGITADGKIVLAGYTRTCANGTCGPLYMAVARYLGGATGAASAVSDLQVNSDLSIFPNPVSAGNYLYFKTMNDLKILNASLVDISGKQIHAKFNGGDNTLNVAGVATGSYVCLLVTNKGLLSRKITIK